MKINCNKVRDGIMIFPNSKMKSKVFCSSKLFILKWIFCGRLPEVILTVKDFEIDFFLFEKRL